MTLPLESLINEAADLVSSEFNLKCEKSKLKIYSSQEWEAFHEANKNSIIGFKENDEGLYVPISYSAYVRSDSPVLISNIFHEYFGHGLFCEKSSHGQTLTKLLQREGLPVRFMQEYLHGSLLSTNPSRQPWGIGLNRITNYEGFAIWMEAWLCRATDNEHIWEQKKRLLPADYRKLYEQTIEAEKHLTRLGFWGALGFPKEYGEQEVVNVLKNLYGNNFNKIDFVVLYGSKKPQSDIDLLIVSENPSQNFFNGWLDIYELNRNEFRQLAERMDISVTDPLFSGELIYGGKAHVEELKRKILNQSISQEAISHNLQRARQQETQLSQTPVITSREYEDSLKYSKTYKINAEELNKGRKILTLSNIKRDYKLIT